MDPQELQFVTALINNARTQGVAEITYKGLTVKFRHAPGTEVQTVQIPKRAPAQFNWSTDLTPNLPKAE